MPVSIFLNAIVDLLNATVLDRAPFHQFACLSHDIGRSFQSSCNITMQEVVVLGLYVTD